MKGAKGGKRDRIISFLFYRKNQKQNEEELVEYEQKGKNKIDSTTPVNNEKQKTKVTTTLDEDIIKKEEKKEVTENNNDKNQTEKEITIKNEPVIDEEKITPNIIEIEKPLDESENNLDKIEKVFLETTERIVKEDLYELEQLQYELEVLNNKQEEEILTDKTEILKQQLQEIIKKFEKIKDKYYPKNKISEIIDIDDEYIYDLLIQYKDELKNNEIISNVQEEINEVKDYISIIEQIINVENETDEIDKNIDDKLEEFQIRDEEFELMKDEFQDIDSIKKVIEEFNKKQDSILKDLEDKVKNSAEISKKIETDTKLVTNLNKLIEAAMLVALSKKLPPTPRGNLIKAGMIISAINAATNFITTKETKKEITKITYTDFSKNILSALKDISNISSKIDESFTNIETIRRKLKSEYGEYSGQLDEFDNLLDNLDNVEKELHTQKNRVVKYDKEFKEILNKNNQKVKRLEEIRNEVVR